VWQTPANATVASAPSEEDDEASPEPKSKDIGEVAAMAPSPLGGGSTVGNHDYFCTARGCRKHTRHLKKAHLSSNNLETIEEKPTKSDLLRPNYSRVSVHSTSKDNTRPMSLISTPDTVNKVGFSHIKQINHKKSSGEKYLHRESVPEITVKLHKACISQENQKFAGSCLQKDFKTVEHALDKSIAGPCEKEAHTSLSFDTITKSLQEPSPKAISVFGGLYVPKSPPLSLTRREFNTTIENENIKKPESFLDEFIQFKAKEILPLPDEFLWLRLQDSGASPDEFVWFKAHRPVRVDLEDMKPQNIGYLPSTANSLKVPLSWPPTSNIEVDPQPLLGEFIWFKLSPPRTPTITLWRPDAVGPSEILLGEYCPPQTNKGYSVAGRTSTHGLLPSKPVNHDRCFEGGMSAAPELSGFFVFLANLCIMMVFLGLVVLMCLVFFVLVLKAYFNLVVVWAYCGLPQSCLFFRPVFLYKLLLGGKLHPLLGPQNGLIAQPPPSI